MFKKITISICIIFSLILSAEVYSQANVTDPLNRVKDLVNSDEIVMLHSQTVGSDPNNQNAKSRIFDIDLFQINPDLKLVPKAVQTDSIVTGNKRMAVIGGNFLGAQFKHLVAAWTGSNNSIRIMIPQINSGTLTWPSANRLTLTNTAMSSTVTSNTPVRLASGNFFGDGKEEFVLGYVGKDSSVKLKMFTVSQSLVPTAGDSTNLEKLAITSSGDKFDVFDICSGDFDGDGYQELALLFAKKTEFRFMVGKYKNFQSKFCRKIYPERNSKSFYTTFI